MDPAAADQEVFGTDRRTVKLPLRATGITFVDSAMVLQIQVADVLSSSFAYWFSNRYNEEEKDFVGTLEEVILNPVTKGWLIGGVWPTPKIDPEALGTEGPAGENVIDAIQRFLKERIARDTNPT